MANQPAFEAKHTRSLSHPDRSSHSPQLTVRETPPIESPWLETAVPFLTIPKATEHRCALNVFATLWRASSSVALFNGVQKTVRDSQADLMHDISATVHQAFIFSDA
jgi:hypothetical protein